MNTNDLIRGTTVSTLGKIENNNEVRVKISYNKKDILKFIKITDNVY